MKFDEAKNSNLEEKNITPQTAMDAYFDDMFGSAEEDPLKKLESEDKSLKALKKLNDGTESTKNKSEYTSLNLEPKRKVKDPRYHLATPQFDEPSLATQNLSSLIIPAAFPKFAPPTPKLEIEVEARVKSRTKSTQLEKTLTDSQVETKTKVDVKTALAILTKQKSKLSIAQKQRLKEKLRSLSKVKSVSSVQVKPVIAKPVIAKPKEVVNDIPKAKQELLKPSTIMKAEVKEKIDTVSTAPDNLVVIDRVLSKNNLPDWANRRFECLLFSVAGLKLAVPLVSLGAIYKVEKEFIPLVGRASWFMGLYHHLDRNVRVIDTAQWVMPERCSDDVRKSYKFIIRLGGNNWGLACDAVHESIQLNPDQIKWRTERTKREWLFGTVIDHMCALIDVDALGSILEQQVNKNPSIFS